MADSSIPEKQIAEWLAFIRELRAQLGPTRLNEIVTLHAAEPTITPEDTLREAEADSSSRSEARYQRRMSSLLAGRCGAVRCEIAIAPQGFRPIARRDSHEPED